MLTAIIGVARSLGGVVLGWWLTRRTSRDEREWRERQTVRERQEAAAAALDCALVDIQDKTPRTVMPCIKARDPIVEAQRRVREAWTRAVVISDPEIVRRMNALDMALFIAVGDVVRSKADASVNFWPVAIMFMDARQALAAFQRREAPPPAELPDARELVKLSSASDAEAGMNAIHMELLRRAASS
jgi:hypothetical protein